MPDGRAAGRSAACRWPPAGVGFRRRFCCGSLLKRRGVVLAVTLWAYVVMRLGIKVGNFFVPKNYVQQLAGQFDFRNKRPRVADDPRLQRGTRARADRAACSGCVRWNRVRYGLHRQDAAMMTCFTPSVMRSDHVSSMA